MDQESNLNSIRALEKQIQEQERALIQLKRARNSLLNVSALPPEVLGSIFRWNVIPVGNFGGLPKASHNFLLVCHHWFQVASGTPGLLGFWGNSIGDWARRYAYHRTVPLDLVLGRHTNRGLEDRLRDALQDRATRDTIRRVHLKSTNTPLLNFVISSITTEGDETRSISMESLRLRNIGGPRVNISNFFSRYHFPRLRHLDISGFTIPLWVLLGSRITSLTTLALTANRSSPLPTLSQMLSILSTNPNLQSLSLSRDSVPDVGNDEPSSKIQLRHLKTLKLECNLRRVFGLLNYLELPDKMDHLQLSLSECLPSDLPQTLGPYLGNYVRRRSPDRLSLVAHPNTKTFGIQVKDTCESDLTRKGWFATVKGATSVTLGEEEADKLCFDTIAYLPQEKVVNLSTTLPILRSEELCVRMCSLTHLHLEDVDLSTWFIEPDTREPHAFKDFLRGLRHIAITNPRLSGGDWSPLTNFLTRRAAVGNRISTLRLSGYPPMDKGVIESIRHKVEAFEDGESGDGRDVGS
jgi:hypothetical protein